MGLQFMFFAISFYAARQKPEISSVEGEPNLLEKNDLVPCQQNEMDEH
jgi:hypothetical protein